MKALRQWFWGGVAFLGIAPGANAATFQVPEDYSTINAAIDASASGDSILVGPGTWTSEARSLTECTNFGTRRSVMFLKPGLTIVGTAGPESTILDGGVGPLPVIETVLLTNADGEPVRLEGFTITGEGRGVFHGCTSTLLELIDCHIVDNATEAILASEASISLRGCVVSGNAWRDDFRDAVLVPLGGEFEATDTRFVANSGRAITATNLARFSLEGCEVADHNERGGVSASGCPDISIRNTLFLRNRKITGSGGTLVVGSATATIEFCTFAHDSALADNYGALFIGTGSDAIVRHNTFFRCYTPSFGAALGISQTSASVYNNVIVECEGPAFVAEPTATVVVPESGCNVFWQNSQNYLWWPEEAMQTDVVADPQFCDPEALDFTVRDSSPAAPANSGACGQIGAHGASCGSVSVEPSTWGRIKSSFRSNLEVR